MGSSGSKSCIFCDIISKKAEGKIVYEDEKVVAFHDIRKFGAEEHILLCPREHIANPDILNNSHIELLEYMKVKGEEILDKYDKESERKCGFHSKGLRTIDHLHYHLGLGPFKGIFL